METLKGTVVRKKYDADMKRHSFMVGSEWVSCFIKSTTDAEVEKILGDIKEGDSVSFFIDTTPNKKKPGEVFKNIRGIESVTPGPTEQSLPPASPGPKSESNIGLNREDIIVKQTCLKVAGELMAAVVTAQWKGFGGITETENPVDVAEMTLIMADMFYRRLKGEKP